MVLVKNRLQLFRTLPLLLMALMIISCSQNTQKVIAVNSEYDQAPLESTRTRSAATPEAALALIDKAEQELSEGKPQASLKSLNRAQRMAPKEPRTYYIYGLTYQELGQHDKAKEFYYRSISLAPSNSTLSKQAKRQLEQL